MSFFCSQRARKGAVRSNCRNPRDMGAIEIALRTSGNRKNQPIFEPVRGMVFDSREEAREFYNMYSWEVGFGIIYNRRRMNDDKSYRSMQEICCHQGVNFNAQPKLNHNCCSFCIYVFMWKYFAGI